MLDCRRGYVSEQKKKKKDKASVWKYNTVSPTLKDEGQGDTRNNCRRGKNRQMKI